MSIEVSGTSSTEALAFHQLATASSAAAPLDLEVLRHYLSRALLHPDDRVLDRVILRSASRRALDLLALHASGGRLTLDDLVRGTAPGGLESKQLWHACEGKLSVAKLLRTARVYALLELGPQARAEALQMFKWVWQHYGREAFNSERLLGFENLAFEVGEFDLAWDLFKAYRRKGEAVAARVMECDLVNPWVQSPRREAGRWAHLFGMLLGSRRLASLDVLDDVAAGPSQFDRLRAVAPHVVDEGPLVSVILTSWKPDHGLRTAVESLLAQSWRNLEILLVDDASPEQYSPLLREVAELDPRIRLLVQPANGGTYLARNAALQQARGEFVTGQDSDDWAHPLRIELQVHRMLADPGLASTVSHALRCDERLVFNSPGTQAARENASSLMFRREPVLSRVGYYDAVRKAGDTEFMLRIRRVFGANSHFALPDNLALIRRVEGSLSNADFRPGWRHASRWSYRRNYEYWHALEANTDKLRLDGRLESERRFPAPVRFLGQPSNERERLDVVFVDDLRRHTDERYLAALRDEAHACAASGLRVGIAHVRSFRDVTQKPIDPLWKPLQAMIHNGQIREVLLNEHIDAGAVIVRRPEVLMFADGEQSGLHADRVVVVAEEPPFDARGGLWYSPEICDQTARDLFGASVEWAAPVEVSRLLRTRVGAISDKRYPVIADLTRWRTPRRSFAQRLPVIGRVVEDMPGEFPRAHRHLFNAYPQSDRLVVRFFNGKEQITDVLAGHPTPGNWIHHGYADIEYGTFLSGCDFYVHYDGETRATAPQRTIAHALAAGCVVIMSREHAAQYGDAVIGASKHEVAGIVLRLADDADAFRRQVDNGWHYLRERHGNQRLVDWLGLKTCDQGQERVAPASNSPSNIQPAGVPSLYRDYVNRALSRKDSSCLDDTIRRTGSVNGRELLAKAASDDRMDLSELMQLAESYRNPQRRHTVIRQFGGLDPGWVLRLARVMTMQNLLPDDREQAMALVQAMLELHGDAGFIRSWSVVFVDSAIAMRRHALARQLVELLPLYATDRRRICTDLANPALGGVDEGQWLTLFNQPFLAHGLEPLVLTEGAGDRFDRITVAAPTLAPAGPRVTVVVTAWQPDAGLLTAVKSVIAQTWSNLEIIIVDDASPASFRPLFDACLALDPRVRVIHHDLNQGTYAARNTAMSAATGEFLTFQDSDDFSHPRRIEWQLAPLLADPRVMATRSDSIRVNQEMVMAMPGAAHIQGNASSLLFRLKQVRECIGYFDRVRKGADTEYAKRIEAAFGRPVVDIAPKAPLAVIRLNESSLSRSEFKPGWRHPARTSYREAYELWHQAITAGTNSPYLPAESSPRHFPVPQRFAIDEVARATRDYDVVFIGDWRDHGGPQVSMIEEIHALKKHGVRIAISHMEAFRFMTKERRPLSPQIRALIHQGVVEEVIAGDDARVGLAILRYPPILQFTPAQPMGWQVGQLMLVANQAPCELDGSDLRYHVADCMRHAKELFGVEGRWAPQGPQVRRAIETLVPPGLLDDRDVPGILEVGEWAVPGRTLGQIPVIGRYSRDNVLKFPESPADLLQAYPEDPNCRIRLMGGVKSCPEILGEYPVPANWELLPYGSMPVKEFLASIDFFVYFDNDRIVEAFGRSILEAMASGCVVILPHKFQEVFGEGALYAAPAEVAGLIKSIHADPQRYAELSAQTLDYVKRNFSHDSYASRIVSTLQA